MILSAVTSLLTWIDTLKWKATFEKRQACCGLRTLALFHQHAVGAAEHGSSTLRKDQLIGLIVAVKATSVMSAHIIFSRQVTTRLREAWTSEWYHVLCM